MGQQSTPNLIGRSMQFAAPPPAYNCFTVDAPVAHAVEAWSNDVAGPPREDRIRFLHLCYQREVVSCGDARHVDKSTLRQQFAAANINPSCFASWNLILFAGCGFDTFPESPTLDADDDSADGDAHGHPKPTKGGCMQRVAEGGCSNQG